LIAARCCLGFNFHDLPFISWRAVTAERHLQIAAW
jgi:hypothetical protein